MMIQQQDAYYERLRRLFVDDIVEPSEVPVDRLFEGYAKVDVVRFGSYLLVELLGEGRSARVFRALHMDMLKTVALKVFRPSVPERVEPMLVHTEGTLMASLHHPGIVRIEDYGDYDGTPYLAMEFIEGTSLAAWMAERPRTRSEMLDIAIQISSAMSHAHAKGIVHRDIKPENILVTEEGRAVLVDFGLARQAAEVSRASGVRAGTPSYMSPEQVRGLDDKVGPRSDVYALGAVLYEMFTGRPPYEGEDRAHVYRSICEDEPEPPRRLDARVPADFEAVVMKCLAKEPLSRYADAGGLTEDLRRLVRGQLPDAVQLGPWGRALRGVARVSMRHRRFLFVLAALLLSAGWALHRVGDRNDALSRLLAEESAYHDMERLARPILDRATAVRETGRIEDSTVSSFVGEMKRALAGHGGPPALVTAYLGLVEGALGASSAEAMLSTALREAPNDPFLRLLLIRHALARYASTIRWPTLQVDLGGRVDALQFPDDAGGLRSRSAARLEKAIKGAREHWPPLLPSDAFLGTMARLMNGLDAFARRDDDEASRIFDRVGERSDWPREIYVAAVIARLRQGDFERGEQWARRMVTAYPADRGARSQYVHVLRLEGLTEILHGDTPEPFIRRLDSLRGVDEETSCVKLEFRFARAMVAFRDGLATARDQLEEALAAMEGGEASPPSWTVHVNRGNLLTSLFRLRAGGPDLLDRALVEFRQAEAAAPEEYRPLAQRLGCELEVWGASRTAPETDDFEEWLTEWRRLDDGDVTPASRFLKARFLEVQGDWAVRLGRSGAERYRAAVQALRGSSSGPWAHEAREALEIRLVLKLGLVERRSSVFENALPSLADRLRAIVAAVPRFRGLVDDAGLVLDAKLAKTSPASDDAARLVRATAEVWKLAVDVAGPSSRRLESLARAYGRMAFVTDDPQWSARSEAEWKRLIELEPASVAGFLGLVDAIMDRLIRTGATGATDLSDLRASVAAARRRDASNPWVKLAAARLALIESRREEAGRILEELHGNAVGNTELSRAVSAVKAQLEGEH